jgi:hypothetical protein
MPADHKMIPARNVTDAHAQDFVMNDELLLPTPKAFVLCTRSLHATRNAKRFHYVCSICNSLSLLSLTAKQSQIQTAVSGTANRVAPHPGL